MKRAGALVSRTTPKVENKMSCTETADCDDGYVCSSDATDDDGGLCEADGGTDDFILKRAGTLAAPPPSGEDDASSPGPADDQARVVM